MAAVAVAKINVNALLEESFISFGVRFISS